MGTAQIVAIVLFAASGGLNLALHGKPREPHSFWTWCISFGIWLGVLTWGGFWD